MMHWVEVTSAASEFLANCLGKRYLIWRVEDWVALRGADLKEELETQVATLLGFSKESVAEAFPEIGTHSSIHIERKLMFGKYELTGVNPDKCIQCSEVALPGALERFGYSTEFFSSGGALKNTMSSKSKPGPRHESSKQGIKKFSDH